MNKITPEQALQMLDNAVSQLNMNREGHIALAEAVKVLNELVKTAFTKHEKIHE
jgi:hypothetical protein